MKNMYENKSQAPTMLSLRESQEVPGSADGERRALHPATLQLVQTLLAGKRVNGGAVLLALLEYASPGTSEEVALVEIQSVQQFSAQPQWPWGYTTTCKILLVLEALGILERHRHHDAVELRISLGSPKGNLSQIYQALDRLLQRKTPKVQRLAAKVKERLQQGDLFPKNELPGHSCAADLQPVTDYLERLLKAYGGQIPFTRRQELVQASRVIAHLLCPATYPAPLEGNVVGNLPLPKNPKEYADGETETEQPACFPSADPLDSPGENFQGDQARQINVAAFSAQPPAGKSSCEAISEFPKMPKNSPAEEQKGNFSCATTLNVNRNSFSEKETNKNVIRLGNPFEEQEGNLLAMAVEGHAANARAYRYYLAHSDPRTVLAAFIYMKQRQHGHKRRPIDSPGAYFDTILKAWSAFGSYEAACEAYQRAYAQVEGGTLARQNCRLPGIPLEVQELVSDFWGWSYEEIAATLRRDGSSAWGSQQTVYLRLWHQLSYVSIGQRLGMSAITAKTSFHRSRLRLSKALADWVDTGVRPKKGGDDQATGVLTKTC